MMLGRKDPTDSDCHRALATRAAQASVSPINRELPRAGTVFSSLPHPMPNAGSLSSS